MKYPELLIIGTPESKANKAEELNAASEETALTLVKIPKDIAKYFIHFLILRMIKK